MYMNHFYFGNVKVKIGDEVSEITKFFLASFIGFSGKITLVCYVKVVHFG